MSSTAQVQQVARKLETMLETALTQLKTEQHKRRESETRMVELELALVNKEHEVSAKKRITIVNSDVSQVKTLEARIEEICAEKDEKIGSWNVEKLFERAAVQKDFFGSRCEPFGNESIYFCGNCSHKKREI